MRKEYEIMICYKDSKVKRQTLCHIIDYCQKDDQYHFVNKFGSIFIVPLENILYIEIRKENM